ncbi:GntR family transcriptional regulator [Marinovum sp. 2_MG-2023]|uniref:GntR family transcriptional regulator n=1 Tax=unclassified Marinovum TaxID=2647166 RepID=UPI0026E35742|nr:MULTISPECIES: GntR family transcriptional regulator [unclassified Marinovum]MDO6731845.1 GntR family transcriptional regulator [Marinovum sp. 2_MG-2023]MDO6781097.1 GntR family transcriptional regulator [Marinovum sp. 1_MG-2023]
MPIVNQRQNLEAKAYTLLRQAIEKGRLNPGRVIVESSVAKLIGASRTPVKAAIAQLHSEGRLSRFSGRGFIVHTAEGEVDRRPITAETLGLASDEAGALKVRSSEKIYDDVEADLVRCAIRGRLRINESDAATHYGVGRTVMHEVLLQAQSNGLVVRDGSSRWHTVALDENRITALYELRMLLEPEALVLTARDIAPSKLEEIASRLTQATAAYPNVSPADLFKMEEDLHIDCVTACPNQEISESLRRTNCLHLASRYVLGNEVDLPKAEPFFREHLNVIRAMQAKDFDIVRREALRHLQIALPKVIARVQSAKMALQPLNLPFVSDINPATA